MPRRSTRSFNVHTTRPLKPLDIIKRVRIAASLHSFIKKAWTENKTFSPESATDGIRTKTIPSLADLSEQELTDVVQMTYSLLKSDGFIIKNFGFPWADAAHTEYKSTDVLYITLSK